MTAATREPPADEPRPDVRRRGLLDFALMFVLVYAVYAKTPLGAIGETMVNVARGQKDRPSWLATFKGRETAVRMDEGAVADASAAEGDLPTPIAVAAAKHKVDPEALAALMMSGQCTKTACEMDAPPRTSTVLGSLAGKAKLSSDDAAQALAAGMKQLENDADLAIEALWIGPIPVNLAVEQARRSSIADPADVEAHASFLSPSMRRGALQGALAVIAIHRLRTMAWPADARFRITSPFGERIHPVTGLKSFHNGTDIGVPSGTPLFAAHKAAVKRQSRDSVSGNYVILDHGLGIETVYCHMSEAGVVEGGRVKRKDTIGLSGMTGRVTGPHLHYILRVREQPIDAEKVGASPTKTGGLIVELPPPKAEPPPKKPPAKTGKGGATAKGTKRPSELVDAGPAAAEPPSPAPETPTTAPAAPLAEAAIPTTAPVAPAAAPEIPAAPLAPLAPATPPGAHERAPVAPTAAPSAAPAP